jgi:hypothetical protein
MIVDGSLHYKDTVMFESAGHVLRYWSLIVTVLHWLVFLGMEQWNILSMTARLTTFLLRVYASL